MSKTYRAILIDPGVRTVTELRCDLSLPSIHRLVGAERLDHFGMCSFDDDLGGGLDYGWLDDHGLTNNKPVPAFLLSISKDPFAGRCLVVGADRFGEACDARLPIEFLRADIAWLGLILPEVHWDQTEEGLRSIVIYSKVKA